MQSLEVGVCLIVSRNSEKASVEQSEWEVSQGRGDAGLDCAGS